MDIVKSGNNSLAIRTDFANSMNLVVVPLEAENLSLDIAEGWVSYRYGAKETAPIAKYSKIATIPTSFTFLLHPYNGSSCINIEEISENMKFRCHADCCIEDIRQIAELVEESVARIPSPS